MDAAATYTRSSTDRSDGASIAAQNRVNMRVARDLKLPIIIKYSDVVESGKDPFRPDFQKLLADMKHLNRGWNTLIIYDTSRLFRGQFYAQMFKRDAKRLGIRVIFSTIPEGLDDISRKMLESQFEVFDEAHSMISKKKGLAGMAENVRAGFRAGGRAPNGYRLKHHETGAIRDGKPVLKATLEINDDASMISRYLKDRVKGSPRRIAKHQYGLLWSESTLVGMEWNALCYAGHTVWNVCNEFKKNEGYTGGKKRRPRKEWVICKDTHQALITDAEAEALIHALETSSHCKGRRSTSKHLLVGLLKTPSGEVWNGEAGKHYRTTGRWLNMQDVDRQILSGIMADMQSRRFVRAMLKASRAMNPAKPIPGDDIRLKEQRVSERISKLLSMAEHLEDPAPCYREIDKLEQQRKSFAQQIVQVQSEYEEQSAISKLSESTIHKMLQRLSDNIEKVDRATLKTLLNRLCEKILLDPETLECQIHYSIRADNRINLASPRGFDTNPVLRYSTELKLAA